jgi:hypothetical protein
MQKLFEEIKRSKDDKDFTIDVDKYLEAEYTMLEIAYERAHRDADKGMFDFESFYEKIND